MRALRIYNEREEIRGSVWAQFDETDAFHHMQSKLARIKHLLEFAPAEGSALAANRVALIDDALDLMNYTAFLIRHIYGWKPDQSGEVS